MMLSPEWLRNCLARQLWVSGGQLQQQQQQHCKVQAQHEGSIWQQQHVQQLQGTNSVYVLLPGAPYPNLQPQLQTQLPLVQMLLGVAVAQ